MKCAAHPEVETSLRCGKCDKPICPQCLVQTPVGARCRECARLKSLPIYQVSLAHYLRALGVGLGLALVAGVLWSWLGRLLPFFYLHLLIAGGIGYALGELISLSVNRKRSLGLQVIGAGSLLLSYLFSQVRFLPGMVLFHFAPGLYDLLALGLGIFIVVSRLR